MLGIFYVDLIYSQDSDIAKGIMKIPSIDEIVLSNGVDGLEKVMNNWP